MAWIIGVAILAILFVVGTLFIIAMPRFKKITTTNRQTKFSSKRNFNRITSNKSI